MKILKIFDRFQMKITFLAYSSILAFFLGLVIIQVNTFYAGFCFLPPPPRHARTPWGQGTLCPQGHFSLCPQGHFVPSHTLFLGTLCFWRQFVPGKFFLQLRTVNRDKKLQKTYWGVLKPQMRFGNYKYFKKNVKFVFQDFQLWVFLL